MVVSRAMVSDAFVDADARCRIQLREQLLRLVLLARVLSNRAVAGEGTPVTPL